MSEPLFNHDDSLGFLNENLPIVEKLAQLHKAVRTSLPFIQRVAVALYDEKSDLLKTFVHSSDAQHPLVHYQARLADARSLREVVRLGRPRVVNDLRIFSPGVHEHSKRLLAEGYGASYTMPMYIRGRFCGLVFFNSRERDVFNDAVLHQLDLFGHLLSLTIINELQNMQTLVNAVHTARDMARQRDNETGAHLDRMSRYARLIAVHLADKYRLDDNFIEHLFMFSPLHDIGKIAIPDRILLKQGKLTEEEFEEMKTHTVKGRAFIDTMLDNFGFDELEHSAMLRNIAELHHEALNGSGYPHGLSGAEIPIEARIIAVADIFDALTSRRPYKEAWSNEAAVEALQCMADHTLDRDCIDALLAEMDQVREIQARFEENPFG